MEQFSLRAETTDDSGPREVARAAASRLLPSGRAISDELWASRHRTVLVLLWLHIVGLGLYGAIRGFAEWHLASELAALVAITVAAGLARSRLMQAALGTLGLVSSSALLVHLSGGLIEAHFHFFIIVVVVTRYQSWVPFLLAMLFVVAHHGTVGVVDPASVYNHQAAINSPWLWAAIHGLFISGAAIAALASWKHAETEHDRAEEAAIRLHQRHLRQREAVQLNDTVVQGLVTAKYATQRGDAAQAADAVGRTLTLAMQLVSDLMEDDAELFEPGGLRRPSPALPASTS